MIQYPAGCRHTWAGRLEKDGPRASRTTSLAQSTGFGVALPHIPAE